MPSTLRETTCFLPNIWLHTCDIDDPRFSYLYINNNNENAIMYIFQVDFHNKQCCGAKSTMKILSPL